MHQILEALIARISALLPGKYRILVVVSPGPTLASSTLLG
jgi:hypothetical protein